MTGATSCARRGAPERARCRETLKYVGIYIYIERERCIHICMDTLYMYICIDMYMVYLHIYIHIYIYIRTYRDVPFGSLLAASAEAGGVCGVFRDVAFQDLGFENDMFKNLINIRFQI